jgi:hypothetical protein
MGSSGARLMDTRIEAEIADQLLRALKACDIANRCHQPGCHGQVNAGDGEQTPDRWIVQGSLGNLPVEDRQVLGKPIEFAHMPLDREPLIVGYYLARQPGAAAGDFLHHLNLEIALRHKLLQPRILRLKLPQALDVVRLQSTKRMVAIIREGDRDPSTFRVLLYYEKTRSSIVVVAQGTRRASPIPWQEQRARWIFDESIRRPVWDGIDGAASAPALRFRDLFIVALAGGLDPACAPHRPRTFGLCSGWDCARPGLSDGARLRGIDTLSVCESQVGLVFCHGIKEMRPREGGGRFYPYFRTKRPRRVFEEPRISETIQSGWNAWQRDSRQSLRVL